MKPTIVALIGLFLISSAATASDYFPEWKELDSFKRGWFSKHLRAAYEKPITIPIKNEVYRFTWLRSFHAPIIVQVECLEKCILNAKQLSGAGGYSPGHIHLRNKRVLTNDEMNKLRALAKKLNNWVYKPDENIVGMDGAQWVFEMAKGDTYQAWNLWSPGDERAAQTYVDMCLYLLNLTNFTIEKGSVY